METERSGRYVFRGNSKSCPWPHIEDVAEGPICNVSFGEWWDGPHHEAHMKRKLFRASYFFMYRRWPDENDGDRPKQNLD